MAQGTEARVVRPLLAAGPVAVLLAFSALQWRADRDYLASSAILLALVWLVGTVLVGYPKVRWLLPAVAPLLVSAVAGLLWLSDVARVELFGTLGRGAAVVGLAFLLLLAAGIDPNVVVHRIVHAVGTVLSVGFGALAFAIFVLPAWVWTRVRRRNPVRPARSTTPTWSAVDPNGIAGPRSLGSDLERNEAQRTITGRLTWSIGCVALLVAANYGIGWAWDRATTDPPPKPPALPEPTFNGTTRRDPRIDLPAMAAYPWREEYFDVVQRTTGGYWPFTEYRPYDFTSDLLNQRGWVRLSYEPEGDPDTMPVAWMFGGSTTWGEGQRDEYTIASHLARISEAEGVPLRVANYGQRGWTHFQEMILYEQQLALEPKADFALFYDGANEHLAQSLIDEAVPTHTLAYTYATKLYGTTVATEFVPQPSTSDVIGDLRAAYEEHSAVHKLVRLIGGDPAGAAPNQEDDGVPEPGPGDGFTGGQKQEEGGGVYDYEIDEQDGVDAGKVYERSKAFTVMLGEQHQVDTMLFWQPMAFRSAPLEAAREQLTDSTIDISDALEDHPEVYIDGGHTNEEGARLVAEEIWIHLEPKVRAWYEENG